MTNVPSSTPQFNFSLPASLQEAITTLRERLVETHAQAGAVAESLSATPGTRQESQALANVNEQLAAAALAEIDRICAALDAIVK